MSATHDKHNKFVKQPQTIYYNIDKMPRAKLILAIVGCLLLFEVEVVQWLYVHIALYHSVWAEAIFDKENKFVNKTLRASN